MRPQSEYEEVQELAAAGLSSEAISRRLGIPSSTIRQWRRSLPSARRRKTVARSWRPACARTYCYVLGLYLGDGYLAGPRNHWFLRVFLDARYVGIVEEASLSLGHLWPTSRIARHSPAGTGLVILQFSHRDLPLAFPQHGPGRKHTRPIKLVPWQAELTRRHPEALLRGLIHSDGCRTVNRFSVELPSGRVAQYEYPRYFFSNLSADIRRIFTDHCELLGIRWTLSNPRNVSISHRDSVARLDSFIGPKT